MEPNRGNQYDDDLTVGLDEIADESFDTAYVDLFEYAGEEESPISRLKNLMLSIEWEITDQILIDFNDELVQAQAVWADDPVKIVYTQALQKITKYIYQKKSDAHHNAMKVLLTFFYDLEKIALDTDISNEEKEEILLADVKKFERFKQQIGVVPAAEHRVAEDAEPGAVAPERIDRTIESGDTSPDLYNLKAYILSIDWEITDRELAEISSEVGRLQEQWSDSKPHALLLQGIDAIGGYIKLMKSASHANAFKLLNSFYLALEKVVDGSLTGPQVKEVVLAEAEKFNRFKEEIGETITPEAIARRKAGELLPEEELGGESPASELGHDEVLAFDDTSEFEQTSDEEDFASDESFSEEALEKVASFFGELEEADQGISGLSAEEALRGVDVETEADDDSDEEALPTLGDGIIAPALAALDEDLGPALEGEEGPPAGVVPGVDVETDADDDSDEAPLPLADGELAPALFDGAEGGADAASLHEGSENDEISTHVENFFDDSVMGLNDDGGEEVDAPVSPALSDFDEETPSSMDEDSVADDIEDRLENFLSEEVADSGVDLMDEMNFSSLKEHVDALKDEVNEDKLSAIQNELARLEDSLTDRPIEKTLTHLISAVASSIGKKSGQFDEEAVELLNSVYAKLENITSSALDQNQALVILSDETAQILKWQQRMLSD